jgi:hypothetical protein
MLDVSKFEKNMTFYNPSASKQFISFRVTVNDNRVLLNNVALYNKDKKSLTFIDSPMHLLHPTCNLYRGLEDVRIMYHKNVIWFTATSTHASEHMTNELVFGRFNESATCIQKIWVIDIGTLPAKNILPFVYSDDIYILDVFQKKIFRLDYDTEKDTYVATLYRELSGFPSGLPLKGSTSPVHLHGDIWGCVVHTDIVNEEQRHTNRVSYLHYWMEIDVDRGAVTFLSLAFWCAKWSFEYISGIDYNPDTSEVNLYGGVEDRVPVTITTRLCFLRNSK